MRSTPSPRPALAALLALLAACADAASGPADGPLLPRPTTAFPAASALPVLRVETANAAPVVSREDYVPATFTLADTTGATALAGALDIRGRGNSTWALFPKKPFRLRLGAAAGVLGMPSNRHWVLLANYSDKTLVRTDVAFELSRRLGFAWTPRTRQVELHLNGSYEGVYQLAEHIRLGPDRVNVPALRVGDTTAAAITGGYLIEVDETRGENFCFNSLRTTMVFCLNDPEDLHTAAWAKHRTYIVDYVQATEAAIFSPQFADPTVGYAAYLDVPSMIDYYLLEELVKNVDANLRRGTRLVKPRGGKMYFGPVWDFDLALGNVNYDEADRITGWHVRRAQWYQRLFEDPAFVARVKARWKQINDDGTVAAVYAHSFERAAYLSRVQQRNFQRWPILNQWVWPNRTVAGSYAGEVDVMQGWYLARHAWMHAQLR